MKEHEVEVKAEGEKEIHDADELFLAKKEKSHRSLTENKDKDEVIKAASKDDIGTQPRVSVEPKEKEREPIASRDEKIEKRSSERTDEKVLKKDISEKPAKKKPTKKKVFFLPLFFYFTSSYILSK